MDPDANLREQLELARRMRDGHIGNGYSVFDVDRLAELVEALDGWITKGGFLPARWSKR